MTIINFLNTEIVKNLLLFNIFDVDEFVLRECRRITKNAPDIWDLSNAKRYSFEIFQIGKDEFYEVEISTDEYLTRIEDEEGFNCFSRLNYEVFESEFPLTELEDWYGYEWLYDYHCNKAIVPMFKQWIDQTDGDGSKKLRLKEFINELNRSLFALENIKYGWKESIPLNDIQIEVIKIHRRFCEVIIEKLNNIYSLIFPDLFSKNKAKHINEEKNIQDFPNPFPDIFKSGEIYEQFTIYVKNHIVEPYLDYSYLFQRLLHEKLIHRKFHKEYMNWLCTEGYISETKRDEFLYKRSFTTKCYNIHRENNFNKIFGF